MIDRIKCKLENLINMPYGFQYEIKNQQLFIKNEGEAEDISSVEIVKDNRNLLDIRLNQKLTTDQIESMKKDDGIARTVDSDSIIYLHIILLKMRFINRK
jgi:hypothetical protein